MSDELQFVVALGSGSFPSPVAQTFLSRNCYR